MIGFACAHGDALELIELAQEVFDQLPPFVHIEVDLDGRQALWPLGDDDLRAPLVEFLDYPVGVEGFVGGQGIEPDPLDQRFDTDRIVASRL